MSDILDKLRAFYENAETDECLYDIRRAIEELERLYALPVFDSPPTWQEEVASVEDAFDRSGVQPTWPADEAGNIGPMAAAMADEIELLRGYRDAAEADAAVALLLVEKLRLTDEERGAVLYFSGHYAGFYGRAMHRLAMRLGLYDLPRDTPDTQATPGEGSVQDGCTLTDEEREAVAAAARIIDLYDDEMDGFSSGAAATLRGLLERLGGER